MEIPIIKYNGGITCFRCSSTFVKMSLSLTLAVLKPDLVLHPMHLAAVRRAIVESKFWVVRRFQLLALGRGSEKNRLFFRKKS